MFFKRKEAVKTIEFNHAYEEFQNNMKKKDYEFYSPSLMFMSFLFDRITFFRSSEIY